MSCETRAYWISHEDAASVSWRRQARAIFKHESMNFWAMHAARVTEAKKSLRSSSLNYECSKFVASHSHRLNFNRWSMGSRRRPDTTGTCHWRTVQ
jgi:hypothetical protein